METQMWNCCCEDKPLTLQTLASIRSLIINPSTSEPIISSILETLTRSLQVPQPLILRHVLILHRDVAVHQPHHAQLVFNSLRTNLSLFTDSSSHLAAESLSIMLSISEQLELLYSMDEFGDGFFVSLCFRPSISVRKWLLLNASRFCIKPYLLVTVLLGFTQDPYPDVRRVALDGLMNLSKSIAVCDDRSLIEAVYCRAIELLMDTEACVRCASVRAASGWWQIYVAFNQDGDKKHWADALFVKLCSMVRDMSMEVRVEALDALGRIKIVSFDILKQTLSKKVKKITKEKKDLDKCTMELFGISAADGAGALMHGLEDEFYQVRRSACHSLRILTMLSADFAVEALDLLMNILNDDSAVVRLEALEAVHYMVTNNCLMVPKTHMHMFLGTLVDRDASIRCTARKIIRSMKLFEFHMLKSSLDSLIKNLELYPQDEADVFSVLVNIGQRQGNDATRIIKVVHQEIEPSCDGELRSNSARISALVVLGISIPLSHDQNVWNIPPKLYSYAITLLGRISHALSDVMDQNTLLAYLRGCSETTGHASELKREDSLFMTMKGCNEISSSIQSRTMTLTMEDTQSELIDYLKVVFVKIGDVWSLIKSGYVVEVLRTLRACKEDLATFTTDLENTGLLAFTLKYLRVVKLLTKVWVHFIPKEKFNNHIMGELDIVLGKLDNCLKEMRYRFTGLSEEEELHIIELTLLTCILSLFEVDFCENTTIKKISTRMSNVEKLLQKEGIAEPSKFLVELKKFKFENGNPVLLNKLVEVFCLKHFQLCGTFKYLKAELKVADNDDVNPLPFISGLPVGIPCNITLYNISIKNRLWIKMTTDEMKTQFVYLDMSQFGGFAGVRNFAHVIPFYNSPKVLSFTLRVSVVMECPFENVCTAQGIRRPKHELTYLCKDVEVFLSMATDE